MSAAQRAAHPDALALALALLLAAASGAEERPAVPAAGAAGAGELRVATLFTAQEMAGALATEEGRREAIAWCRRHGVEHAFIESFRDGYRAEEATLAAVRDQFAAAGIIPSGCITPTGLGKRSTGWKTLSCYTAAGTQAELRELFAAAARLFGEIMIDDFLCTDCECEECLRARGEASWPEYRMRLLREVSARDILAPARAARPDVRVIIKYPQWYDDFHNRGYDAAGQSALYPAIWVGTETRDPDSRRWGRKAQYEAYFIMRWLGGIGGEKTGGGWFDPYGTSPRTYVEQARQTVLAGAREMLLFCHHSLIEPQNTPCPEALIPELPGLRDLARRVRGRMPRGIAAAKPPGSQPAKGEEYFFDYAGMLGLPLVPSTAIPAGAPAALITSHAARDPATAAWLGASPPRPALLSPAAEAMLPAESLGGARAVERIAWKSDPREVMDLPREALDRMRAPLLAPLGVRLSAPGRVAFYLFAPRLEGEEELAALENFNDDAVEVALEAGGRAVRLQDAIVLPPSRREELRRERRGDAEALTIPPRALVAFALERRAAAAAAPPREPAGEAWRIEPERQEAVLGAGEEAAFLLEGTGPVPEVMALDIESRRTGAAAIEELSPGRFRAVFRGLAPGHHRLVLERAGVAAGARSFAVLPAMSKDLPSREGTIACDAAISWLVAHPGRPLDDAARVLRLARLAGLHLLRDRISWGEVEPRPGEFRWGRYDDVASASRDAGLDVYQIFHASPPWSRADRDSKRAPDDLRAAHRFARAAAERFRGRVIAWEPWNEPDIPVFSDDPADQLAAFQKAAYLGFKEADPGAAVLMVSLAHPPGPFIESFLENETAPFFDVYNFHTYDSLEGYGRRFAAHAAVRERYGIAAKPVWVTEAGIGIRTPSGDLSPEEAILQAEFLPRSYVLSLAGGAARHFFFILPHFIERGVQFGLLERDLGPGPGYAALAALAAALGDAREARPLRGLPPSLTGWLFERGDGLAAAAVWGRGETPLDLAAGIEARDLYGRALAPGPGGALAVGERIVYLIGGPERFAAWSPGEPARPAAAAAAAPAHPGIVLRFVFKAERSDKAMEAWRAESDGTLAGKLQVYNFTGRPFAGAVRLTAESGVAVEPLEAPVRVAPHGLEAIEIRIRRQAAAGEAPRRVRASAVPEGSAGGELDRSSAAVIRVTGS